MKNISLHLFQNAFLLPVLIGCMCFTGLICFLFYVLRKYKVPLSIGSYHWKDFRNLLLVTGCYAIVSFTGLGSHIFPNTTWQPTIANSIQDVIFSFDQTTFDGIYVIYGEGDNNALQSGYQIGTENVQFYGSNDHENWTLLTTLEKGSIFQYQIIEGNWDYRYVLLRSQSPYTTISEIGFRNLRHDGFIHPSIDTDSGKDSHYPASLLIDEQEKLVLDPTYYDESYFDEIYHARNAWEIASQQDMYASVHPLFGTNLMAFSISLFGTNPFGWRFAGHCLACCYYLCCII